MLCVLAAFTSCFKDDTTEGTGVISEITIDESTVKEQYDIDKNETLTISPKVTQTDGSKPLTYTWEIDQEVYAQTPELVFVGKELGTFQCRLIVENEDGKAFRTFTLNVNSPYEEGYTIVSSDENGKSMLSFMMKQRTEGVADYFYDGDCFALNNPDFTFADNVSDVVQCNKSLVLACQGNEATGQPTTFYFLNDKTFVVENYFSTPEYPDFRPYRVLVPSNVAVGSIYPVVAENGKVYDFSMMEGAVSESVKFKKSYSLCTSIYDTGTVSDNVVYVWDKDINGLFALYRGFLPLCCKPNGNGWLLELSGNNESDVINRSYFKGHDFVFMFSPRAIGGTSLYGNEFVMVTKIGVLCQKTIFVSGLWYYNEETATTALGDGGGPKFAGVTTSLTERTPYVATQYYNYLLYGNGNKVMRWIYTQQLLNAATEHATVGSANAVITAMELSPDHTETFVAFYEPDETGLNGHVWVLDTENGTVLRKYDNICYRPVKIIYKRK